MASFAGTAHVNGLQSTRTAAVSARRTGRKRSKRVSRNAFIMVAAIVIAVFMLIGLSAYAASIQHANNVLTEQNSALQAEIDSLNSQIVEETKVTRVEKVATEKYGMVYPTSDNCIYLTDDTESGQELAATIKSEAYK